MAEDKLLGLLERARDALTIALEDTPRSLKSEGRKTTLTRLVSDLDAALKPADEAPPRRTVRDTSGREYEVK